jgi:hypothetical protein
LDDDSTDIGEDAKAELFSIGREVVQPLVAAVGPALIDLLGASTGRSGSYVSALTEFPSCGV